VNYDFGWDWTKLKGCQKLIQPHPGPLLGGEGVGDWIFDTAVNYTFFSPSGRDVRKTERAVK